MVPTTGYRGGTVVLGMLLMLSCLAMYSGCGNNQAHPLDTQRSHADELAAGTQQSLQPVLAFPRVTTGASGPGAYLAKRYGADYAKDLGNANLAQVASRVKFSPTAAVSTASLEEAAYGIYRLNCYQAAATAELQLTWYGEPPQAGSCWIGVSDWAQQRWQWTALPITGNLQFVPTEIADTAHHCLVAIVIAYGDSLQLADVHIDYSPDGTLPYILFAPTNGTTTYLMDLEGNVAHTWESEYRPNSSVYLQPNGHLLRPCDAGGAGGIDGRLEEFDWEGNLVWYFQEFGEYSPHHDIEPLPNGNILAIADQRIPKAEALAHGRVPGTLNLPRLVLDSIVEIKPLPDNTGEIVWTWNTFDHLVQDYSAELANYGVIADHPELLDINFDTSSGTDFTHANSIDYNAELDQIVINFRSTDECYVIDHSATTIEAAGHTGGNCGKGGDFLYRWGNPAAYQQGTANDRLFFKQHDAEWIPPGYPGAGNLLVYNNGYNRPGGIQYSEIIEFKPDILPDGTYAYHGGSFRPDEPEWAYAGNPPEDVYSWAMSGSQRLRNGNTFISLGIPGHFLEVNPAGELIWEYTNPYPEPEANTVFRADRYDLFIPDFPMDL